MARVFWTDEALRNLDSIGDYLDRVAPERAEQILRPLVEAVESLMAFPRRGRAVPELSDPSVRELIVGRYRIIYRIEQSTVTVRMVFDAAMDASGRIDTLFAGEL